MPNYTNGEAVILYPTDPPSVTAEKNAVIELQRELEEGGDPDVILPKIAKHRDMIVRLYSYYDGVKAGRIRIRKRSR